MYPSSICLLAHFESPLTLSIYRRMTIMRSKQQANAKNRYKKSTNPIIHPSKIDQQKMSSTPTTKEEEEDSFRSTNTTDSSNSKGSTVVKIPVKKNKMKKNKMKKKSITVPAAFNSVVESISISDKQRQQAQAQCTSTATQTYRIAAPTAAPGGEKDEMEKELGEEQEEYTMIHKSTIPAPRALETMGKAYASEVFPGGGG